MKVPTASVISGPASASPSRNRISMASMLRTKLSLKTEKNWHQNKGAKRRAAQQGGEHGKGRERGGGELAHRARLGVADDSDDAAERGAHFALEFIDMIVHFVDAELRADPAMVVDDQPSGVVLTRTLWTSRIGALFRTPFSRGHGRCPRVISGAHRDPAMWRGSKGSMWLSTSMSGPSSRPISFSSPETISCALPMRHAAIEFDVETDRGPPVDFLNGDVMDRNMAFGRDQKNALEHRLAVDGDRLRRDGDGDLRMLGLDRGCDIALIAATFSSVQRARHGDLKVADDLGSGRTQPQRSRP